MSYRGLIVCLSLLLVITPGYFSHASDSSLIMTDTEQIPTANPSKKPSAIILKQENTILTSDLKLLMAFSSELETMKAEMYELRKNSTVWELDYFPPEEHDKIENLLFRYLVIRNGFWELVNYYKDFREHFTHAETQTKGFLIGYNAGLQVIVNSSLLVATFINEPAGKSILNEAYPRSEIPAGTYDMLLSSVTSIKHLEAVKIAWLLFCDEKEDEDSTLYKIYNSDPEYRSITDQIFDLHEKTEKQVAFILKEKSPIFPNTTNRLRHTAISQMAVKMRESLGDNLYAIRCLLFSNVSDIKIPLTNPLSFSPRQRRQIHGLLKPGDIILTYTAGYMSNIFLPGVFKHGIIYIGSPKERDRIGLIDDPTSIIKGINVEKLKKDFLRVRTDSGHTADVIEAVAEGVIFNSLDLLLDSHINRMVVLRPRINKEERREELLIVFALLGCDYDFKFDFTDGSYQCCTEVIYRALNSRGTCNFNLVNRMGIMTLSADDILDYYQTAESKPFDIILYADKSPSSEDAKADIYTGNEAYTRITELMRERHVMSSSF